MRPALLAGLLCFAASNAVYGANYFSEGWKPGQATARVPAASHAPYDPKAPKPVATQPQAAPVHAEPTESSPKGFWEKFFTSGPLGDLLTRAGLNVSAAIEKAAAAQAVSNRIPFITDENFAELIVNEKMSFEEEGKRVWFLVITHGANSNNAISQFVDKHFDEAYDITLEAGDLPHVRWGRINYLDVTYITTKWNVWKPPVIVVLTERGKKLRFYSPGTLVIRGQRLHDFLEREVWKEQEPWAAPWAPGGPREWILEYLAIVFAFVYNKLNKVPKFVILLATGGLTSVLVNFLHRNDKPQPPPRRTLPKAESPAAAPVEPEAPATTPAKKAAKKRKGAGI